jgi:hypothetical protein
MKPPMRSRHHNNNNSRECRHRRATSEMCAALLRLVATRAIAATVVSASATVDRNHKELQRVGATMEPTMRARTLSAVTCASLSVSVSANVNVVVRLRRASPPLPPLLLRLASATHAIRATAALRLHRRAEGAMMHLNINSSSNSSVLVL